jgi:RNA polymerase sigma-70 factor (ECF subfamily)
MQAVQEKSVTNESLDINDIARTYYDCVFRFCARRIGPDAAADAAQETFVTAQRVLRKYRGDAPLKTWLLGIANNECRRLSRKRKLDPASLELKQDPSMNPESTWVDRQALTQAMQKLSPEHREAVILIELDGLSYDEASAVLGVPAGTVKSRLHYAFVTLRRSLFSAGVEA